MTLREKLGIMRGETIITPEIEQEMFVEHIWDYISELFFSWRTNFRNNISVHVYQKKCRLFSVELRCGEDILTETGFTHDFTEQEAAVVKRKIMMKGIHEGMMVSPEGDTEFVIWY